MGAAGQADDQVRLLGKTLQQEFKELNAQRAKVQLCACVEQLRRKAAKSFLLEPTIAAEKQPNYKEPKTPKKQFLRDRLAMERAKTIKDPDLSYSSKFQRVLDNFVQQVNNVFLTKPLTYKSEQDKCWYVGDFLRGISADNWEAYDHWNLYMDNFQYVYAKLKLMFQEYLFPRYIWQVNVKMKLKIFF